MEEIQRRRQQEEIEEKFRREEEALEEDAIRDKAASSLQKAQKSMASKKMWGKSLGKALDGSRKKQIEEAEKAKVEAETQLSEAQKLRKEKELEDMVKHELKMEKMQQQIDDLEGTVPQS